MEIRALVFNSGTYERADLSKMTEKELYELYQQDEKSGMAQVQCYTLDEFSEAFNDEEVSDQDWLYFVDLDEIGDDDDPADRVAEDDPAQEVYASYSEDMRKAVAYINEQLEPEDKAIICAKVDKNFKQHMNPAYGIDDGKIIDLLEEYGDDHDLPEGWWMEECDMDDIVLLIQFEN